MKRFKQLSKTLTFALAILSLNSCIRSEAPNSECDIISAYLPEDILLRSPVISNDAVNFRLKKDISPENLAPEFVITPGATIFPESGTVRDFTTPQTYTVISEDGQWSKEYTVNVEYNLTPVNPNPNPEPEPQIITLVYSFENVRTATTSSGKTEYDIFYEKDAYGQENLTWASANQAFALTLQGSTPNTFPTYQVDEGVEGKCVQLVTRSTGSFGARVGKPIAAGNLFFGTFDMTNAIKYPLQATHFGIPFERVPATFSGYYKYTPGETYCEPDEKGQLVPVPGVTDQFNVYAVLFEVSADMEWLDGANVLSEDNPNIISTALIPDRHASEEWVEFSVPFIYREGKSIDLEKLANGQYSIAVVMSSSAEGDYFRGAIGSTLTVDELTITCIEDTDEE